MKARTEIEKIKDYGLLIQFSESEWGGGIFRSAPLRGATVVWTYQDKHVSIWPKDHIPTWEEMCKIKDMFYNDEDEVWQCHPKKSQYVNIKENCLHLWEGQLK